MIFFRYFHLYRSILFCFTLFFLNSVLFISFPHSLYNVFQFVSFYFFFILLYFLFIYSVLFRIFYIVFFGGGLLFDLFYFTLLYLILSNFVLVLGQAYAKVLAGACGTFRHSDIGDRNFYGENLYMCWGSTDCYTPERVMYLFCKSYHRRSFNTFICYLCFSLRGGKALYEAHDDIACTYIYISNRNRGDRSG